MKGRNISWGFLKEIPLKSGADEEVFTYSLFFNNCAIFYELSDFFHGLCAITVNCGKSQHRAMYS